MALGLYHWHAHLSPLSERVLPKDGSRYESSLCPSIGLTGPEEVPVKGLPRSSAEFWGKVPT